MATWRCDAVGGSSLLDAALNDLQDALGGPADHRTGGVSLRPVSPPDLATIDRWAGGAGDHMSRTRPLPEGADRHDPDAGLFWYVIAEHGRDVGTVWIELAPAEPEAVLGIFLGDPGDLGRGIGSAAIGLAAAEFRRNHAQAPIVLRVRRANHRAISCYRRAGFAVTGSGSKTSPSGEVVPYYRMALQPGVPSG
jgi:RimJ/RimL family protein N-acetyltransferase